MHSAGVGVRWLSGTWILAVVACAAEPPTGEASAALTPVGGQGQDWQGQDWQGQDWQGQDPQGLYWYGVTWDSVSLSGVTYGSVAASSASVSGTVLEVWTPLGAFAKLGWRQRFPDHYCDWNADRSVRAGCTTVDLDVSPSPLAGTNWVGTFRTRHGTVFQRRIRIGRSTSDVGAVKRDETYAMHPLDGHASAAGCDLEACDNPAQCRKNCDLWRYDVTFPDWPDETRQPRAICPSGESGMPFSGTWDALGGFTSSTSNFTFACTSGVIYKCAKWGYRPFGVARRAGDSVATALAPYHQVCLRAASADYCGERHSFTRNGTLIDIYDGGFIPRTKNLFQDVTALAWEARFDALGGMLIDHMRYQEAAHVEGNNVLDVCPGQFLQGRILPLFADVNCPTGSDTCLFRTTSQDGPTIRVDSARACAHTEQMVGKWLNRACHDCVSQVDAYCSDPYDPRGWDAACVSHAAAVCGSNTMAAHSECATGPTLRKYDSGCTLAVCLDDAFAHCCGRAGTWSSECVAAANAKCTGGREGYQQFGGHNVWFGFCGGPSTDPLPTLP